MFEIDNMTHQAKQSNRILWVGWWFLNTNVSSILILPQSLPSNIIIFYGKIIDESTMPYNFVQTYRIYSLQSHRKFGFCNSNM